MTCQIKLTLVKVVLITYVLCICVLSCFSCVQRIVTLSTVACQAPVSMGFSRQEYWSGLPCPTPGDLPDPGIEPVSLMSPTLAGRFFTTQPQGSPLSTIAIEKKNLAWTEFNINLERRSSVLKGNGRIGRGWMGLRRVRKVINTKSQKAVLGHLDLSGHVKWCLWKLLRIQ